MKKIFRNKKQLSLATGIIAATLALGAGGYYWSTQKDNQSKEPEMTQQEKETQENLENKEKQLETTNDTQKNTNSANTSPSTTVQALSNLSDASITAMKEGDTIYLSVYGIGPGYYEVEKNGQKLTLSEPNYLGSGGLALPNINTTGQKTSYQIFLLKNGKRTASSKVIPVTTNFSQLKEFK